MADAARKRTDAPEAARERAEVAPRKRADARRNEKSLLDAAAEAFVAAGVDVPVREIAVRAGVGVGTIYRHFPTRADLIVAVYRHCTIKKPMLSTITASLHLLLMLLSLKCYRL